MISKLGQYENDEKKGYLNLHLNENLMIDNQFLAKIALKSLKQVDFRQYPSDSDIEELTTKLSQYLRISPDRIYVGAGLDQLIDLALWSFTKHGGTRSVSTITPTYQVYKDRINLFGKKLIEIPLENDFKIDASKFLKKAKGTEMAIICSPNNPTGNQFSKKSMLEIISNYDGIVVIDEAYAEFANYSLSSYVEKYDNLVILRSMSKSFGLANIRLGYMISNKQRINKFKKNMQSLYPTSGLSIKMASLSLSYLDHFKNIMNKTINERERLFESLSSLDGITVFHSDCNFILFNVKTEPKKLLTKLKKRKILIREIGSVNSFSNCFRVTVGTRKMNELFLNAMKDCITHT